MYAIIDAPGYCGDYAKVYETHADRKAALAAKHKWGKSVILISGCHLAAGEKIGRGPMDALLSGGNWHVVDLPD